MNPLLVLDLTGTTAPHTARAAVRGALRGLSAAPAVDVDDVLLVVTELVTNAVTHGEDPLCLQLVLTPGLVEVSVADASPLPPRVRHHGWSDEGGRGMALVAAVTAAWGVEPHEGGKRVWARFAA